MIRNELLKHLDALPPDVDVVVRLGATDLDIVEIVGVDLPSNGPTAALALLPADLTDAWREFRTMQAGTS